MHEGNIEYGCYVNPAKSQANFETTAGTNQLMKSASSASEGGISWCGMLINPNQLQIYVNYEK
uniref:Telomerase reverse transcriptase n=1 Tax=Hyaloperonospora arabidopsidis (strain Emoy2) TaxID=559515 RepID=M4BFD8_HYAAE